MEKGKSKGKEGKILSFLFRTEGGRKARLVLSSSYKKEKKALGLGLDFCRIIVQQRVIE